MAKLAMPGPLDEACFDDDLRADPVRAQARQSLGPGERCLRDLESVQPRAQIEQELTAAAAREGLDPGANPGAIDVDFLPHLIPMTRGILSTCHVRPTRAWPPISFLRSSKESAYQFCPAVPRRLFIG